MSKVIEWKKKGRKQVAEYQGMALEIVSNGGMSRSLTIDGRKVLSGDTVEAVQKMATDYLCRFTD